MKKIVLLFLLSALIISLAAQDTIFFENFDQTPGTTPAGWSTELESGDSKWQFVNGGGTKDPDIAGSRRPSTSASGVVNAMYFFESLGEEEVILITPPIDLEFSTKPELKFQHAQVEGNLGFGLRNDELQVYYKTNFEDPWMEANLLASYVDPVDVWTEQTVILPAGVKSSSCYLGFKAKTNYGWGVCIDDLCIYEGIVQPLVLSSIVNNTTEIGGTDGSIELSITGGLAPYTYTWSNSETSKDISGLAAGVYSVEITDALDSIIRDSIRVYDTFIDRRDGKVYKAITIGDQTWMAENLNAGYMSESEFTGNTHADVEDNSLIEKYCYNNDPETCDSYGGLYDWKELIQYNSQHSQLVDLRQGVCPDGWHIPSDDEFKALEVFLGMLSSEVDKYGWRGEDVGSKLKEPGAEHWNSENLGSTNESGFLALGSGYRDPEGTFTAYGMNTYIWTDSPEGTLSFGRGLSYDQSRIERNIHDQNSGYAVRCVKNNCTIDSIALSKTDVSCYGGSDGSIDLDVYGTSEYNIDWSNGDKIENLSGLSAGWYKALISDELGCAYYDSLLILQPEPLEVEVAHMVNISCFEGSDGVVTINPKGGVAPYEYYWDHNQDLNNITANELSANVWYRISVTDANLCTTVDSVILSQPDSLEILFDSNDVTCFGGTDGAVTTTVSGGTAPYNYYWSSGTELKDLLQVPAGFYRLDVSDSKGCLKTASISIQNPQPILVEEAIIIPTCSGGSDGAISISTTGGNSPYVYSWSTGDESKDLMEIHSGAYSVNITDFTGCTHTASFTVLDPLPIAATATIVEPTCFGLKNGAISIDISQGNEPYEVLWSNDSVNSSLTNLGGGWIGATITDAMGCTGSKEFFIPEPSELSLELTKRDNACFGDSTGLIYTKISGGVPDYILSWENPENEDLNGNLKAGVYMISITDANNCYYSESIELVDPDKIAIGSIIGEVTTEQFQTYTYSITDQPGLTFQWLAQGGNVLSGQGDHVVEIQWGAGPSGKVELIGESEIGCKSDTVFLGVDIGANAIMDNHSVQFEVYPNPSNDRVTIICNSESNYQLDVCNLNGQILLRKEVEDPECKLDISSFTKGIYLLRITTGHSTRTRRITKI